MSRRISLLVMAFAVAVVSGRAVAQDPSSKVDKILARVEENKGATTGHGRLLTIQVWTADATTRKVPYITRESTRGMAV